MSNNHLQITVKTLFFIPSFYGALTWGVWLFLYFMKLIPLDECSTEAMIIFLFVEAMFILSTFVSLPHYTDFVREKETLASSCHSADTGRIYNNSFLVSLHVIGFLGLAQYVIVFSRNLGGISGFFLALVNEAYAIRWETETSAAIGTQLSYFGWMAIGLTVYQVARKRLSSYWLILALIQFLGNLMFIDRTRPIWIAFTSVLMILFAVERLRIKKILRWLACTGIVAFVLFWLVAEWTGKTASTGLYDNSVLPGITQEIYVYGVAGFAYFNKMLESNEQISYRPERIVYPALKYLAKFEVVEEPPSQVLDFLDVPFSTNVGTFLEPLYRDGGFLFVVCGIIFYSFGIDFLGRFLLGTQNLLAVYAWSNLCFTSLMGFFTPKLFSFPIWLFIIFSFGSLFLTMVRKCRNQRI